MKKWLAVLGSVVGALLLATLVTGAVFAQGPVTDGDGVRDLDGTGFGQGRGFGRGFVDEDGDGVCDVCGGLPGEGENQMYGRGRGYGLGFVDEDGDGVNDRYGTNPEFVDEDGDGLCDIHGVAPGEGTAQGYGRGFRTEGETPQAPMARRGGYGRRAAAQ